MQKFPVIIGPTAGGKSSLAVELCLRLNELGRGPAEVITADSMQVYRGMDIGTAKPTADERRGIPHHLIDLVNPSESFTVDQWLKLADETINEIQSRGGTPVVVGGTNLYVKALLEGLFDGPPANEALRAELAALTPDTRRAELERADPAAAARIHPNDTRRTIRALEVFRLTGRPISDHQEQWDNPAAARPDALVVGLDWPAPLINQRINSRVKQMMADGLLEEVKLLLAEGQLGQQAREALGYKQLIAALEAGSGSERDRVEGAIERIKIETRRFAKNQRTWLKRFRVWPGSLWIEASSGTATEWAQVVLDQGLSVD